MLLFKIYYDTYKPQLEKSGNEILQFDEHMERLENVHWTCYISLQQTNHSIFATLNYDFSIENLILFHVCALIK